MAEVVALHVDSILDFLEEYEESEAFMEEIGKEHVGVLSVLVELVGQEKVGEEVLAQLIKRLLVLSLLFRSTPMSTKTTPWSTTSSSKLSEPPTARERLNC